MAGSPDLDAAGCWRLAQAVLRQAAEDVGDERLPEAEREEARAFLRGGGYLELWASVLGVTIDSVRRQHRQSCGDDLEVPAPLPARVPPRSLRQATGRRPDARDGFSSIFDGPAGGWFIEPDFG